MVEERHEDKRHKRRDGGERCGGKTRGKIDREIHGKSERHEEKERGMEERDMRKQRGMEGEREEYGGETET